jgi:hypothetical protein
MRNMMSRFREGDIMKDFSGIEFASEHNGTDVFRLIELAYEQGQKDGHSEQLGTNLAEVGTDCISRQSAIELLSQYPFGKVINCISILEEMPSAQPQRTCVNCGRTVNNGGWYADGRTRCPIEEHYALPKDGYCHLWEKRNVTDDDYPERREE